MSKSQKTKFTFSIHSKFIFLFYWIGLITFLSNQSYQVFPDIEDTRSLMQIIRYDWREISAHIIEFFVLTFLLLETIFNKKYLKTRLNIFLTILFVTSFAFLDEIHQYFIPGRSSSFFDIACDLIGMGLAILFYILVYEKKKT